MRAHARQGIALEPLVKKVRCRPINRSTVTDTRIAVRRQIRFLNLVADALHDELLGFHLAQSSDIREFGLPYYVAASSDEMGDALRRLARFSSITNEAVSTQYFADPECKARCSAMSALPVIWIGTSSSTWRRG